MKTIVIASNNNGKIKEIKHIFANSSFQFISQAELNIPEIAETGLTFIENAIIKARHVAQFTKHPVLADDSGLVIPKFNYQPGLYSARFADKHQSLLSNTEFLLQSLCKNALVKPDAYFYSAIVYLQNETDPMPLIGEGIWHGKICENARGNQGFGYDPIFYLPEYQCTAAELSSEIKNQISHRAIALKELVKKMESYLCPIS